MILEDVNNRELESYTSIEQDILQIAKDEYKYFFNKANVEGVGLGYKEINRQNTYENCIKVFVSKKCPLNKLRSQDVIPTLYKGIKTDVLESGCTEFNTLIDRVRPVIGGYSIGSGANYTGGSYGCLVTDDRGTFYMLSCNHVLAANRLPVGTIIVQPAVRFGGRPPEDTVANLANYIPIKYITPTEAPENYVDCAVAEVIHPNIASPSIAFVGIPTGVNIPHLGEQVKKVGKTTELTFGQVISIGVTTNVYAGFGRRARFVNQIITTKMSTSGDSGAVLLNMNNEFIGLIMGSTQSTSTVNTIFNVLDALRVKIVTQ